MIQIDCQNGGKPADICKVFHIRYWNKKAKYILNGTQLESVDSEVNLE